LKNFSGPGPNDGMRRSELPRLPRSAFDRSFDHKTAIDSAYLYPLFVDEVLPGDSFSVRPSVVFRLTTPLYPFMDELRMDWQFFYVPLRLVWTNFVKMMGERENPDDHIDYTVPQVSVDNAPAASIGTLWDYLGMPCNGGTVSMSALYSRSINLIWNEWYRDENLQDKVVVDLDDGPDDPADYVLLRRGKRKDYFWGALPFAQKGDPVSLPLGTRAPVLGIGQDSDGATTTSRSNVRQSDDSSVTFPFAVGTGNPDYWINMKSSTPAGYPDIYADLSAATAATINEMRQAIATQHLLERDARGGTRYRELVLSHFGVQTDDIRLMRPKFLASGSSVMEATQVPNTAYGSGAVPVGNLGAFAHGQTVGGAFHETFREHGLLIGLFSVRAAMGYQQGLPREFSRLTRYDYYWNDFASLGEQAVLSREIYADGTGDPDLGTGDYSVFGYQPRYEEYRQRVGRISGAMRSQYATSLDPWHLALDFSARPVLNATYIEEAPPIDRVIVVASEPEFKVDVFFRVTAVRPMPKFATPGLLRF